MIILFRSWPRLCQIVVSLQTPSCASAAACEHSRSWPTSTDRTSPHLSCQVRHTIVFFFWKGLTLQGEVGNKIFSVLLSHLTHLSGLHLTIANVMWSVIDMDIQQDWLNENTCTHLPVVDITTTYLMMLHGFIVFSIVILVSKKAYIWIFQISKNILDFFHFLTNFQCHTELMKCSRRKSSSSCWKKSQIHFIIQGRCSRQDLNYRRPSKFGERQYWIAAAIITVVSVKNDPHTRSGLD